MLLALTALPTDRAGLISVDAWLRANAAPDWIDLGTAVCLSLSGLPRAAKTEEGVVIEVVQPGQPVRARRVLRDHRRRRAAVAYVVQCHDCRLLRRAGELLVISL